MRPFFTIVVCTYNRQRKLSRALDSIQSQSCTDWEVVVVDDGSTDATGALLDRYQESCSALTIASHRQNRGVSAARNTGIGNANGRYITFLDSDDEYTPNHLANRKKILQGDPGIQLLHGGLSVVGDPFVVDKDDFGKRKHVNECAVGGTFFIRRDVFDQIGLFQNLSYAEDAEFFERAVEAGVRIERTNIESYIYYRNTPNQITSKVSCSYGKTSFSVSCLQRVAKLLEVLGWPNAPSH